MSKSAIQWVMGSHLMPDQKQADPKQGDPKLLVDRKLPPKSKSYKYWSAVHVL